MKEKGDHRPRNSAQYERVVELLIGRETDGNNEICLSPTRDFSLSNQRFFSLQPEIFLSPTRDFSLSNKRFFLSTFNFVIVSAGFFRNVLENPGYATQKTRPSRFAPRLGIVQSASDSWGLRQTMKKPNKKP